MFPRAITLARIRGIPVRVDPTLLLIALLVVWTFTNDFRTESRPVVTAVAMAAVAALLFFASILAHELGHALEARHRQMDVHSITLFLFGGVTEMRMHASGPRDEFVVAAVGPWTSIVMAAIFGLVATGLGDLDSAAAAAGAEVAGLLGWLNLLLGIFNLVPGAPLDGGRVLRALLWGMLGDRGRASRWAARAGQGVAGLIMALGFWTLAAAQADFVSGLWLIFIGSFIWNGARAELGVERVRGMLEGRTAAELARTPALRVDHDRPLSFVALDLEDADVDVALVTEDDLPIGLLRAADVVEIEAFDREIRTAGDVAASLDDLPTAELDMPLDDLLDLAEEHPAVVIRHDGEVLTVATTRSLAAILAPQPARTAVPPPPPPPPPSS
ncbi:MAG TPA: site-2 protease family protein [Nitriliruptorales bacterium]